MKKEDKHIINDNLLIRFLSKEANDNEILEVNKWLNGNEAKKKYLDQLEKVCKHSETINDFYSIDTKSDFDAVMNKIEKNKTKVVNINSNKLFLRIAASIIILLGIGILFNDVILPEKYLIVDTYDNQQKEIILADGSIIKLNANSKLEYPEKFKRRSREVKLEGEAFFEIEKNPDKSFKISANNSIVEVLGTSFNINSKSNQVIVDVVSGKVAFFRDKNREEKITLIKGERGIYKENKLSKSANENSNFLAWKTGILEFRNSKLKEVIPELEKYYGNKFIIKDTSINDLIITTTIDNQPFEDVLDEFEIIFNIDYQVLNDSVILSNKKKFLQNEIN